MKIELSLSEEETRYLSIAQVSLGYDSLEAYLQHHLSVISGIKRRDEELRIGKELATAYIIADPQKKQDVLASLNLDKAFL